MDKKRDKSFDFYKGLLMIGVVYGHVLTALQGGEGITFWIHEFIRTYDMPMFAFISGIFLKKSCNKHNLITNISNKVGSIFLPTLIWEFLFNLIGGSVKLSLGRFWFLPSIFFVSIIIIIIDTAKNKYLKTVLFLFSIILFHTVINDQFNIGFLLAPCVVGYYYDAIKNKFNKIVNNYKTRTILKAIVIFIFILSQCFWKIDYNVWNLGCCVFKGNIIESAVHILFRFIIGITGCYAMKCLFDIIRFILSRKVDKACIWMYNSIVQLGQITSEVYILHSWLVALAGTKVVNILAQIVGFNIFTLNCRLLIIIFAPIITLVVLLFTYFLQKQIKKIPYIGKYSFNIPIKNLFLKIQPNKQKPLS